MLLGVSYNDPIRLSLYICNEENMAAIIMEHDTVIDYNDDPLLTQYPTQVQSKWITSEESL